MLRSPTTVFSVARLYPQWSVGAITAYCSLATSPLAVLRTKLYAARFGPIDTSYHDINQKPGTLMFMLSCHKPPLYQAGSLGARLIIAPPVATGISSAKIPFGPSTAFRMSISGKCRSACDQSTGGACCARSKDLDARIKSSCEVPAGKIGRTWFCSPLIQAMKSICTAPPRYQLPCSQYGATRPTPAPKPCGMIAASAGLPCAATANCHSAVEEQPIKPTLPVDQGCFAIHEIASSPSLRGGPRMS